ncbi:MULTISPECIES: hypothetical protein [unclassified Mesorhizobium]|uniref:hypothetical protein n=1 Tax=unclassified Mesorhizobium TaxID=325217 RepID=UPI00333CAE5C
MNRLFAWRLGAALLIGAPGVVIATAVRSEGPAFIADGQPMTEDQVRQKLQSDGYTNVQIVRQGKYLDVIGSKNGKATEIIVDSQTGKVRGADGDDDDD